MWGVFWENVISLFLWFMGSRRTLASGRVTSVKGNVEVCATFWHIVWQHGPSIAKYYSTKLYVYIFLYINVHKGISNLQCQTRVVPLIFIWYTVTIRLSTRPIKFAILLNTLFIDVKILFKKITLFCWKIHNQIETMFQ